jgi:TP901 family phage tail tape measure protein
MAKARGVVIPIVADVRGLVKGIGNTEQQLNRLGRNVGKAGATLTRNVTLPIIGASAAAIAFAADFNKGMANVATLLPGNTARVNELKQDIMDLGPATGKSLSDLTDGLYQVVSAFGDTADTTRILEINARAATAGLATTTDAINLTSAVTKGYGDTSAAAVLQASDLALLTVRLGQTTFPELAASIGKVIPLAAALNVSQEELFATMATLTGVTGGAAEVSTQMRGAMQSLLAPTADAAKAIEAAGFASGEALIKQRGFAGAVEFLVDAAKKAGVPLQKFISSIEGQTFALALTGAQADEYQKKLKEMQKAQGTTDQAFAEATTGAGAAAFGFAQLRSNVEVMAVSLGDGLAPALNIVFQNLQPVIDKMVGLARQFANADKETQTFILKIIAAVAALGPMLMIIGKAITIFSTLRSVIIAVRAAQIGLNLAMIANPIGIIVIAIAALVAGLIIAYKRSETFRNIVDQIAAVARNVLGQAVAFVKQKIEEWGPAISSAYAKAQPILRVIGKIVQTYVTVYIRAVSTYIKVWATVIKTAYEVMRPIIIKIGGAIRDYIVAYVTAIRTGIDLAITAFNTLRDTILGVVDRVSGPLEKAAELIRQVRRTSERPSGGGWFFRFSEDAKKNIQDAVARATQDARRNLQSLGSSLTGMVQTAIGARSPEAVEARRIRAQQEEARKLRERARLDEAIATAATAEERQQAQQDLDDWLLEEEAKRLEESVQKNQDSAQQQIDDLIAEFNRGGMSAEVFQQRLSGLLGPDFGMELGMAFRDGFQLALQELIAQVQELVGAAGGITPSGGVSPAAAGAEASTAEREKAFEEAQAKYKRLQDLRKKRDKQAAIAENNNKTKKERENAESLRKQLQNQINNLKKTLPGRGTREPRRSDFGLAKGGILKKTVFAAGEMGPEAVIPLGTRGGANILRDALLGTGPGARAQQQGGGTYNITINAGLGTNPDELSRVIVESIRRFEKRNGRVFSGPLLSQTVNTANKTDPTTGQTGTFTTIRAARLG